MAKKKKTKGNGTPTGPVNLAEQEVLKLVEHLDEQTRQRVFRALCEKFGIKKHVGEKMRLGGENVHMALDGPLDGRYGPGDSKVWKD